MNRIKVLTLAVVAGVCFTVTAPKAQAGVDIDIGVAPSCPYGYYDYPPYACAPYGYYGPEWFSGGVFVGAGPWFHGRDDFHGHVDNHFDVRHGYKGPTPNRGDRPEEGKSFDKGYHFKGNEMHDGRGHAGEDHR